MAAKRKRTKGQSMVDKIQHRKLKIVNSGAPEGYVVPAPLVVHVVLL